MSGPHCSDRSIPSVSWMLNFGILGSFAFAILVGFLFRWLRQKDTALSRAVYPMLCGWLAFSFFRDDFGIVIVKEMVEASIIFPLILFGLSRVVSWTTPEVAKSYSSLPKKPSQGANIMCSK